MLSEFKEIANAKVVSIKIGSMYHDGRSFFSMTFEGKGWGQSAMSIGWTLPTIDKVIEVCGGSHLLDCEGKLVRILKREPRGYIEGIAHILDDSCILIFKDSFKDL